MDIIRHLLFNYLDGPSACALLKTCTRFCGCVNIYQRQHLRLKPRDGKWHARRVLEKAECCPLCLDILHPNRRPFVSLDQHMKKNHFVMMLKVHCQRCRAKGTQRELFPWVYMKMTLRCASCKIDFSTNPNYWEGRELSCMKCGPVCDFCLNLKFHCEYCKKDVTVRHECPGQKPWSETWQEWKSAANSTLGSVIQWMDSIQQPQHQEYNVRIRHPRRRFRLP